MSKFDDHPTVRQYREQSTIDDSTVASPLDADWLRSLCLELGADDVGFVEIDRPEIAAQRQDILVAFPPTKTLVSFVCRMNRENVRSLERSVANVEFHTTGDEVNQIAREIVATLEQKGIRALNPAMGFPMEMDRFPGKSWVVSHKPVAVAAGLGHMGIHRNVIHPKFGNFILLGTILIEAEVTKYNRPIDYNPCLECKLCVVACPVGAIGSDGHFNFSACYTHNYREFMGGFTDWVEDIAESKSAHDYRQKVNDSESASMWQSLAFKSNYKAAYCLAACPAGEDVIGQFLRNKKGFVKEVVQPLQDKEETIYVVPGSDAQDYVARRFPHKKVKQVSNSLRPNSIQGFLSGLPLVFQRNQSVGLDAIYHFTFTGKEECQATVIIKDKTIQVENSHIGTANIHISADSYTWLQFLAKEQNIVWALIRRKIRVRGSLRLLQAFGKCFP
ncbi:MAG: SCP2 sterol-binding domain-containing protein [Nostoc sp. DedVER02]|uniref:SCP2 sterol-binding domain-containing protein n=1 Tax=unclassified Nostoc TaxID=2593658 RepID=UPI002AD30033|nr:MULTISPECIES: SCP2 sterol-binding domain-containing protein [unclassified Nostoc]MDZ7990059.1 SCP2 sterol-binding domain-containing protein [Nostoc sp. DedVER02]MDZ8111799.1 SCP2 sterol-binding domain-containing protein [Nostoc sp. DedVER01b]